MTNIKLSKRLHAIADMVENESTTIDIGCDHALLDIYLLRNKTVKKAIAADITEGAINQAKKNIELYKVNNLILRQANGLDAVNKNDNIDTIIISGLGNQTIIKILYDNVDKLLGINTIIIQSNTGYYDIRKNICKLGYYISDEKIVKDNNIKYVVIKFKKNEKKYTNKELLFGPILLRNKDELFVELLKDQINKNNKVISMLPKKHILKKIKLLKLNNIIKKEIH